MTKHRSQVLKEKMDKNSQFQRVLIAKNYDSVSFNYRKTGRWMVVHKDQENSTVVELWFDGSPVDVIGTYTRKGKSAPLTDIKSTLDLIIDNDQRLYNQSRRR